MSANKSRPPGGRPPGDDGPEHPCDAGDGQYFRLNFANTRRVKRAGVDPWRVIPIMAAHNLRDGDGDHRNRHPADPKLRHLNIVLAGKCTAAEVAELAHDTLKSLEAPPSRVDAVVCWEAVMKPPIGRDGPEYWRACLEFLAADEATAAMPVVSAVVHRDQGAVHSHTMIVPIRDGQMVSRSTVNPMAMRARFFAFMRERLGIRTDTPAKRREKRAKTMGDFAAMRGKGARTAGEAAARDAAFTGRIDPETGELKHEGFPLFGVPGFDLMRGWALAPPSGGIHIGGIHVDALQVGGIHISGIHVGQGKWSMCMPPMTTCAVLSPLSATSKTAPSLAPGHPPMGERIDHEGGDVLVLVSDTIHEAQDAAMYVDRRDDIIVTDDSGGKAPATHSAPLLKVPDLLTRRSADPAPAATAENIDAMWAAAAKSARRALGQTLKPAERFRVKYRFTRAHAALRRGCLPDMSNLLAIVQADAASIAELATTSTADTKGLRVKATKAQRAGLSQKTP